MQRDPAVRALYAKDVGNLLDEILGIDVHEFFLQQRVWAQLVEIYSRDLQHWEKFLETTVHDGYLARWISILLAPDETLRPYVWPTDITIPKKTAEDILAILKEKGNTDRLQEFTIKLCEINTPFDVTHIS